jgi:hypothetical protein
MNKSNVMLLVIGLVVSLGFGSLLQATAATPTVEASEEPVVLGHRIDGNGQLQLVYAQ